MNNEVSQIITTQILENTLQVKNNVQNQFFGAMMCNTVLYSFTNTFYRDLKAQLFEYNIHVELLLHDNSDTHNIIIQYQDINIKLNVFLDHNNNSIGISFTT